MKRINVKNNIKVTFYPFSGVVLIPGYIVENCETIAEVCYMACNYIINAMHLEINPGDRIQIYDKDNDVIGFYATNGRKVAY